MNAADTPGANLPDTSASPGGFDLAHPERYATTAAGVALAAFSLKHGGWLGFVGFLAGGGLVYRGVTGRWPASEAIGRGLASARGAVVERIAPPAKPGVPIERGIRVNEDVTIDRPVEEVYGFFRDLRNLPRVMRHVERVQTNGTARSHWIVRGPAGSRIEWDAEIIDERPNELISWRSREGADVPNTGTVYFKSICEGMATEFRVELKYDPPAGEIGAAIARLLGESPEVQMQEDLERLKGELERHSFHA